MLDELVKFAQANYPEFASIPLRVLHRWFETYKNTTIIDRDSNGEITGFGIYQKWPDFLNFIVMCGKRDVQGNLDRMLTICREKFPGQMIGWFDENKMKARFTQCHQQQQL